jgi:hypothetical protein
LTSIGYFPTVDFEDYLLTDVDQTEAAYSFCSRLPANLSQDFAPLADTW